MPAPTITGSSNGHSSGSVASFTLSHTANATDPLFVVVVVFNSGAQTPGTCTYNGIAMAIGFASVKGAYNFYVFVAEPPGAMTADIVYTPGSNHFIAIAGYNVNGAALGFRSVISNDSTTAPTVAIAAFTDELILDVVASDVGGQTFTEGAGQTLVFKQEDGTGDVKIASSTEAAAASVTMSWTLGSIDNWSMVAFALVAASANGGNGGGASSAVLRGSNVIPYETGYY